MQIGDTTPVKINGSNMASPFDKLGNNDPAKLSTTVAFRDTLKLF